MKALIDTNVMLKNEIDCIVTRNNGDLDKGPEKTYALPRRQTMTERAVLLKEIDALSPEYVNEVADFVEYIKQKQLRKIPETMCLSEAALAKEWDTPDEDAAWQTL